MLDCYGAAVRRRQAGGPPLHDPCAIAYVMQPEIFGGREAHVTIETSGEHTIGRAVAGPATAQQPANATVIEDLDADAFFSLLTKRLSRLARP